MKACEFWDVALLLASRLDEACEMCGVKKHQRAPTAFQEPGTFETIEFSRHRLAA